MADAYIFDAVRTPRGKGKKDGSLHQATPVWQLRGLLQPPRRLRADQLEVGLFEELGP